MSTWLLIALKSISKPMSKVHNSLTFSIFLFMFILVSQESFLEMIFCKSLSFQSLASRRHEYVCQFIVKYVQASKRFIWFRIKCLYQNLCSQKSWQLVVIITSIYVSSSYDWDLGQGFHLVLGVSNIWNLATIYTEG